MDSDEEKALFTRSFSDPSEKNKSFFDEVEQEVNNEVSDAEESKSEDEEDNDIVSKPKIDILDKQIIELSDDELEESQLGLFNKMKDKIKKESSSQEDKKSPSKSVIPTHQNDFWSDENLSDNQR